jgi:hypothetical protein
MLLVMRTSFHFRYWGVCCSLVSCRVQRMQYLYLTGHDALITP